MIDSKSLDSMLSRMDKVSPTSKTESEKETELLNNTQEFSQLVFPENLLSKENGHGQFVLFNINTSKSTQYRANRRKVENEIESPYSTPVVEQQESNSIRRDTASRQVRSEESIVLGMPNQLTTNYGVQWNASELGVAGRAMKSFYSSDRVRLGDIANSFQEEITKAVAGAAQAVSPVNIADAVELNKGSISNPFVEVLFKGVNNREAQFQFKFTATSQSEMYTIRSIIRRFKFHQHPEYKYKKTDSAYFLYPSTFDITFMLIDNEGNARRNEWLHRLSTCALTNFQTDYTPDGEYNIRKDHSPVSITCDMSFIELEQLHKGRFTDDADTF